VWISAAHRVPERELLWRPVRPSLIDEMGIAVTAWKPLHHNTAT